MRHVLLFLLCGVLTAGCDQSAAPGQDKSVGSTTSAFDGRPIIQLTAKDFASGKYVERVRDDLASRGSVLPQGIANATQSIHPGQGSETVLLKDLYAQVGALARPGSGSGDQPFPSTHLAIDFGNGYTENRLLTLEAPNQAISQAQGAGGGTYIVGDPDLDADAPEVGQPYQKQAVSLSDPSDIRTVTFLSGNITVEGDPAATVLVVSTMPVIDAENMPAWGSLQSCEIAILSYELGTSDAEPTGCDGGGGGGDGGGGSGGSNQVNFPSYMMSNTFLAIRSLRTDSHGDHGASMEVQMHIQPTDNYSLQFPKKNNYRFDKSVLSHNASGLFGSSSYIYGPAGGPGYGTESQWNAVEFADRGYTRFFWAPDVNRDNTDYSFITTGGWDWDWELSRAPAPGGGTLGYLDWRNLAGVPFPLHALSTTSWRGIVVEDDNDVRHFAKRLSGSWGGQVNTYDFSTGGYASVHTQIDADPWATANDDVFTNSGYRRATAFNVQSRLDSGGLIRTDANGFRYTFATYTVTNRPS